MLNDFLNEYQDVDQISIWKMFFIIIKNIFIMKFLELLYREV